jgi:3-phenylpropionate/trans-cinnamate dioxygenase ferredoxin reductase subunit
MAAGRPTYVVVGANLTGGRAVEALRADEFDGRIVLVGAEPHRPYERPPLSKELLRGEVPPDKPFLKDEAWYAQNDIELVLGVPATAIDPGEKTVALSDGRRLSYDKLLIATGGRVRTLNVPGADLEGVFTLRTIDDALAIRERLMPGAPVVVIGAGFIGSEVAASAKTVGCEVTLLELAPVPLVRAIGEECGRVCAAIHREHGVDLRTGIPGIERIEGDGGARRVVLTDGSKLDAAVVVVGVGIDPATELAESAGLELANGIVVDERCETSIPDIYAAGDVAHHPNPVLGERIRVEHWQNAQNQGAAAARAMLGKLDRYEDLPWFWSDQYDVNIQMFGHPVAWDRIVFRGDVDGRSFSAFYVKDGRVLAVLAINRAKEARAARALIQNQTPVTPEALADEGTDLKALAKA